MVLCVYGAWIFFAITLLLDGHSLFISQSLVQSLILFTVWLGCAITRIHMLEWTAPLINSKNILLQRCDSILLFWVGWRRLIKIYVIIIQGVLWRVELGSIHVLWLQRRLMRHWLRTKLWWHLRVLESILRCCIREARMTVRLIIRLIVVILKRGHLHGWLPEVLVESLQLGYLDLLHGLAVYLLVLEVHVYRHLAL